MLQFPLKLTLQPSLSNLAKTEVLRIWNCRKSIIIDLGYFAICSFEVIWCPLFGGKIQIWLKSIKRIWLLKKLTFNVHCFKSLKKHLWNQIAMYPRLYWCSFTNVFTIEGFFVNLESFSFSTEIHLNKGNRDLIFITAAPGLKSNLLRPHVPQMEAHLSVPLFLRQRIGGTLNTKGRM